MTPAEEHAEKRRRLLALLDAEDLDALVLRRPGNVAWYSGGGRTHVVAVQETGVADVVVTRDDDEVVTAVNEAARIEEEELASLHARFTVLPWDSTREGALPEGARIGADGRVEGMRDVSPAVEAARRSLTEPEADRYRALGADAAAAVTKAARRLNPRLSEYQAAAAVAHELIARGIDPVVLLVAGADRLPRHRHPLPTHALLGDLAMIVVCARRGGLIASLTRLVAFRALSPDLRDAYARLLEVDVAFNSATVAGAQVGDVFGAGASAYAANGLDRHEWQRHHQGGPTGYEPRDYLATAESEAVVEPNQAFAWNPSVPSLKSEDTILAGGEVLTADPLWPTVNVGGMHRPLVLEL